MKLIALTGGIGSGKSVVSRLLSFYGFSVYDCDSGAKRLMEHDTSLMQALAARFGEATYLCDDTGRRSLNRPFLASALFGHPKALADMNALVHPAVARDIAQYAASAASRGQTLCFYESAILYEANFARLAPPDEVWMVSAPEAVRLARITARDHCDLTAARARIDSQWPQEKKERLAQHVIYNDDSHLLTDQLHDLLSLIIP